MLPKFIKSNYSEIKRSSLQKDIDKHFKPKYFCEYFFSWVLNFVVHQTRYQILQVLKFCICDSIRISQVSQVDFLGSQIFHISFNVYVMNEYLKPLNFHQLVPQITQNSY